jgi:hypothetical protein
MDKYLLCPASTEDHYIGGAGENHGDLHDAAAYNGALKQFLGGNPY